MDPVMLAAINKNYDVSEALLSLGADPTLMSRLINEATGEVEQRPARLSELAVTFGHPPGVKGMLTVLMSVTENLKFDDDTSDYSDDSWKMRTKLLGFKRRAKREGHQQMPWQRDEL